MVGPRGYTLTIHSHDLRSGGLWHYTCTARRDGLRDKSRYLEVIPFQKWSMTKAATTSRTHFRVTRAFRRIQRQDPDGYDHDPSLPEAAENTKKFIKKATATQLGDRLADIWKREPPTGKFSSSTAVSRPPRDLFKVFTDQTIFPVGSRPRGHDEIPQGGN